MWSQVRLRQTWSVVGGDLICLAVVLPSVSVPTGWSWSLCGTASQAMGPQGSGSYHGGGEQPSFCPLSASPRWAQRPLGTGSSCSLGEPHNEIKRGAHAVTVTYTHRFTHTDINVHEQQLCTCAQIKLHKHITPSGNMHVVCEWTHTHTLAHSQE